MNSEEGEITKEKRKMNDSPLMIKSKELALLYIKKLNSGIMCAKKRSWQEVMIKQENSKGTI